MPLSEHEQKMLDQLELQLSEDTQFATQMRSRSSAPVQRGRVALGALLALGGIGLVLAGVATQLIWLGVLGFIVMVIGGYAVATPRKGPRTLHSVGADGSLGTARTVRRPRTGSPQSTFMDRLAARWERRRRNGEL